MKSGGARWAVGLMAGTSLDGIDAALVEIRGPATRPQVRLASFVMRPYPASIGNALLRMASGQPVTAGEVSRLNYVLGDLFAQAALTVCREGGVAAKALAVIGSHGQTVFHQGMSGPQGKHSPASTLQIGEPAMIAARTGALVVADFRAADLAAGGQGAPLVPMADYLLLRDAKRGSVALNLGGVANVAAIPAAARPGSVTGFDTGPANMLMDGLVRRFTGGQKSFDRDGEWARQGQVIEPVLGKLLRLPFFRRQPPKSAGREQFGEIFMRRYFLTHPRARPEDLLRTATELTAQSVAQALARFVFPRGAFHRLIVSGGGSHNKLLVERLGAALPGMEILRSDDFGLPTDAKEAMAFALLADRTLHGLPGNLPAVTGARREVILGKITRW